MTVTAESVLTRDPRAIARAATLIENRTAAGATLTRELLPYTGHAFTIGITGPPGAGKSTLADRLTRHLRSLNLEVAVLAIDPSSGFTQGAILGDRIRMQQHSGDPGVFIRSMASRGAAGGLAPATSDVVALLDAAGFDVILIETLGVGQDEIAIAGTAHVTAVVLVPGAGDDVQALKAGLLEIADIFAVNKSDLPGADAVAEDLRAAQSVALHQHRSDHAPVVLLSAALGTGIPEFWTTLENLPRRPRPLATQPSPSVEIDHIGIAVHSIAESLDFYRDLLGMPLAGESTVSAERVNVAMLPAGTAGNAPRLELLEAADETSPIARFLAKHGPGLHHIALRVDDLAIAVRHLEAAGCILLNEPRAGAGGHRYVFVHPRSAGGVLLELIQK